jgi:FAD:protein FMN transferase
MKFALLIPLYSALLAAHTVAEVPATERVERSLVAMGTHLEISLVADSRAAGLAASEAARAAIEVVEARLSTWRPDSELSRLNASDVGASFTPTPLLASDLERAFRWRDDSDGAFDPGLGLLVDLWDLRGQGRQPSAEEIEETLRSCGKNAFSLALPHSLSRNLESARLEEGGFGKGAALDAALASLRALGIEEAHIDLGGQSAVLCGSTPVTLGVAHPDDRSRGFVALELPGGSIATSGNSERGLVVGTERIGHVLDPHTGRPAKDFGSVTVWSPSAFDADCLSTALYVMGPEEALKLAATLDSVEALVLQRSKQGIRVRATQGLKNKLHTLDSATQIEWIPIPTSLDSSPQNQDPDQPL